VVRIIGSISTPAVMSYIRMTNTIYTDFTIDGGLPSTTVFAEYIYAGHYSTSIFPEEIDLGNEVTYADLTGGTPDGTYTSIGTISGGTPATTGIYDIIDGGYI